MGNALFRVPVRFLKLGSQDCSVKKTLKCVNDVRKPNFVVHFILQIDKHRHNLHVVNITGIK